MKRLILLSFLLVLAAGLAFAADQIPLITKINLQTMGKSVEGGIAVNPVTHKAYVIAELSAEGTDDAKVVFVLNDYALYDARLNLPLGTSQPVKAIPIRNENEYIAVDSARNLIYVPTRFSVEQDESDSPDDDAGDVENPGGDGSDGSGDDGAGTGTVMKGTLTVIDGNTDTVIAVYDFPEGVEPEGVAIDPATGIVYVGAKAPEGESALDDVCNAWATPIYDVGEPADVECWTAGSIYAFLVNPAATPIINLLKTIPAGDDPESVVFANGMVYAANEDDGTITIASAVNSDGTGGTLLTDVPQPPTRPYSDGVAPYSLGVFYGYGPNLLACVENKFEADKMASGGGSVFITDDRSRVAKITGTSVFTMLDVPGATVCEAIPNSDGGGLNSANNVAFMPKGNSGNGTLYVLSEQNTLTIVNPRDMSIKATITVPGAVHLDGIAVDPTVNRVWLTDEVLQAVFVLEGACANGTGVCVP